MLGILLFIMPKYTIANILGHQKTNNEFYTPQNKLLLISLKKLIYQKIRLFGVYLIKLIVNLLLSLKKHNYKVIYSHIDNGQDFYNYEPDEYYSLLNKLDI